MGFNPSKFALGFLITGIPTSKKREVIRQIKKADFITRRMDSIDTLSPTAKATAKTENVSTSQSNSTIDKALLSKKRINNEPFIDKNGARLYEWENKEGVRFRVVINDIADMDSNPTSATEEIITFYSDRNLKERMKFKNFTLDYDKDYYKNDKIGKNNKDDSLKNPYKVETQIDEWVAKVAQIKNQDIKADLKNLAKKHPEMFAKPSDVFKLFVKIKNNPTHFLNNNRQDVAMIAKIIDKKKIGKLGIKKDSGEVVHITKRDIRNKDIKVKNPPAVESPTHLHTFAKAKQGDGV